MVKNDCESFLTPEDFGGKITENELVKYNNHPLNEIDAGRCFGKENEIGFKKKNTEQKSEIFDGQITFDDIENTQKKSCDSVVSDDEVIGRTSTGEKIYKSDDLRKVYEEIVEEESESLLNKTPYGERYYLRIGTVIKGRDKNKNTYKGGYSYEESIVKRVKNEDGKYLVKEGLNKYQALTKVKIFFESRIGDGKIKLFFDPGETFYASKEGEDKDKRKEMLEKNREVK